MATKRRRKEGSGPNRKKEGNCLGYQREGKRDFCEFFYSYFSTTFYALFAVEDDDFQKTTSEEEEEEEEEEGRGALRWVLFLFLFFSFSLSFFLLSFGGRDLFVKVLGSGLDVAVKKEKTLSDDEG